MGAVREGTATQEQPGCRVSSPMMKEAVHGLVLLLLQPLLLQAQLVGHRGVISLPDNFEYRDEETRAAALAVAEFALAEQPLTDHQAEINKLTEIQKSFGVYNNSISFYTYGDRPRVGGGNNDNFYFATSRLIETYPENDIRKNAPPGRHPCFGKRPYCDVPEHILAEALELKANKPENEDGLANELQGAQPDLQSGARLSKARLAPSHFGGSQKSPVLNRVVQQGGPANQVQGHVIGGPAHVIHTQSNQLGANSHKAQLRGHPIGIGSHNRVGGIQVGGFTNHLGAKSAQHRSRSAQPAPLDPTGQYEYYKYV